MASRIQAGRYEKRLQWSRSVSRGPRVRNIAINTAGKAIVASNLPAIREILTHDVNAVLVTPGDADALAAGICRLADDGALRETLGGAARAAVAEYSWDRRAARLEALFTEVMASTR